MATNSIDALVRKENSVIISQNQQADWNENSQLLQQSFDNNNNFLKIPKVLVNNSILQPSEHSKKNLTLPINKKNAQYDYVKGMFSEEEIKEAFSVLDLNKDGVITEEDLTFFTDLFGGEKVTQEDLNEMIRMCDSDGSGEVKFDEFMKLATGKSLAPIAQSFQLSKEIMERRNHFNRLMMKQEKQDPKFSHTSPRFGVPMEDQFTSPNPLKQIIGSNPPFLQNKKQYNLNPKDIMNQRRTNCLRYLKEQHQDYSTIFQNYQKIKILENGLIQRCSYEEFIRVLQLKANHISKLLFNALTDLPLREEYVKNSDQLIAESHVNLKYMLLSFLGLVEGKKQDKFELAFQIEDIANNGFITYDELLRLITYLQGLYDISNFDNKLRQIAKQRSSYKQEDDFLKKDFITKENFLSILVEYNQMFEPI